jgi:phosphoglycolate phosphatase-like HAD superfamily hydrolase
MPSSQKEKIYALDFDGVICDSAVETAITGWLAAQSIWPDMQDKEISAVLQRQFRMVRPLLEFGYEAILIVRLLQQGVSEKELLQHYHPLLTALIERDALSTADLQQRFGATRDQQIAQDEAAWIASNPLFEGVAEKLTQLTAEQWYIVTTKQERFVERILSGYGIGIAPERIFGLDRNLGKQAVLTQLDERHPDEQIIFIEDRLPTLLAVKANSALQGIHLQLADWGYNTDKERNQAKVRKITVISIDGFLSVC